VSGGVPGQMYSFRGECSFSLGNLYRGSHLLGFDQQVVGRQLAKNADWARRSLTATRGDTDMLAEYSFISHTLN